MSSKKVNRRLDNRKMRRSTKQLERKQDSGKPKHKVTTPKTMAYKTPKGTRDRIRKLGR